MSILKKVLIVLVLVLPLSVAGYLYWRVNTGIEQALHQATEMLAPYAALRYTSVAVDWEGTVTLGGVELRPSGTEAALPVRSVAIVTPGLRYLMARAGSDFRLSGRPDRFSIKISDLAIDLTGGAGSLFDQLAALAARREADGISHCGDHKQIGLAEWRGMGINRLHADATFTYSADRARDTAAVNATVKIKELLAVGIDGSLSQVNVTSESTPWLRGHITKLKLSYKDDGYLDTLKRFCAGSANVDAAAYVDAETGGSGSIFLQQFSLALAPTLRQAYREFLGRPELLELDMAVPPDFLIENVGIYNRTDLVDSLTFSVSFNGKRADDLQYGFRAPNQGPSQALLSAKAAVEALNKPRIQKRNGESAGIIDAPKYIFQEVPKAQLSKHLGKRVRFHINRSSMREGLLTSIDGGTAQIQQSRGANEVSIAIVLRHVERVEVAR